MSYICESCNKEVKLPIATQKYMAILKKKNETRKLFCPFCGKDEVVNVVKKNDKKD
jgi:DNA-directed RNA polymerase subunit RPC12/RpoP